MTKLLQTSALAALFIFLAACGDEPTPMRTVSVQSAPAPAMTPLPTAAPEPTSTTWPASTPTLAPAPPLIPRPTETATPSPTPSPTPAVVNLKITIDDGTTWRELFDMLSGSERNCMETGLGDNLELLLDSRILGGYSSQDQEFQMFSCLSPENGRGFFVAAVLSDLPLDIDPAGSDIECIMELVADKDIAAMMTLSNSGQSDESLTLELWVGVMLCIPDLLMTFVGTDPSLLNDEENECVRTVFQNMDADTLTAWVVPDPHEVPAKAMEFVQTLEECAPDMFEGGRSSEEPGPPDGRPDWPEEGTPLALGEMTWGVVDDEFDSDSFVFEAVEGETYRTNVIAAPGNLGVIPDLAIFPWDLEMVHCALKTDSGGGATATVQQDLLDCAFEGDGEGNATITWTAPRTGTYIIEIQKGDTQEPLNYSLIITGGMDVPTLTGSEIETVKSIIDNDATLSGMELGDYRFTAIGPWVSGEKKPIGAIAELVLANTVTFHGKVPMVAFEPDEATGRDYKQGVVEIHAEGIRNLVVLVDLSTEAVAGVEVGDADSFVIAGEPVPMPTPTLEPRAEAMPTLFQPLEYTNEGSIMAMGLFSACALQSAGEPLCWNFSKDVEPISPDVSPFDEPISTPPEGESFVSITSGNLHFCGLREDGKPVCWLAVPDSGFPGLSSPPQGERFSYIDSRDCYTCGLLSDGTPLCWAQIRGETHCQDYELAEPPPGERFVALTGYGGVSCGLRHDGTFLCYPDVQGVSQREAELLPKAREEERFSAISMGGWSFCALRRDGTPTCWFWNVVSDHYVRPDVDPDVGDIVNLSTGAFHGCGLRETGEAVCWWTSGRGNGQLPSPEGVFVAIASEGFHSCGLRADGSRQCWTASLPG